MRRQKARLSADFARLRAKLDQLNDFIWSTELAYGITLADPDLSKRPDDLVQVALKHVVAKAWFPNAKGAPHYNEQVKIFRQNVEANISRIYSTAIVVFSADFEAYLESRRSTIGHRRGKWGPYFSSLCSDRLYWEHSDKSGRKPISLKSVLIADICRIVRNTIAHGDEQWPKSVVEANSAWLSKFNDLKLTAWCANSKRKNEARWGMELDQSVQNAFKTFVGGAQHKSQRASQPDRKELPIQYFYMLFTLTALDRLALEIEEATLGAP